MTGAVPVMLSRCHDMSRLVMQSVTGVCRLAGVSGWAAAGGEIWVMQNIKDVREYEYRVTPNRQQTPERRHSDAELDYDNIELQLGS